MNTTTKPKPTVKPKLANSYNDRKWIESNLLYALVCLILMMLLTQHAQAQVNPPPFKPEAFNEWVTVLSASVVYLLTFISYKIPYFKRITSTSVRYVVIALVSAVFLLSFGLLALPQVLQAISLPSFLAVILKTIGLSTPKVETVRTAEEIAASAKVKHNKINGN